MSAPTDNAPTGDRRAADGFADGSADGSAGAAQGLAGRDFGCGPSLPPAAASALRARPQTPDGLKSARP
ncbi:hypothetical protein ABZ951_33240, partial [Streptomyces sp. NPDC046215]|uniref:hypothetical protein n=1 Tax=Streptomyces sp. NPDC046215 TaxID=3155774 RepID=UPI0033F36D07